MIEHPYSGGASPEWAHAWGEDRFGLFAEVEVKGVTFRFRWIPPGSFEMGSPPEENFRSSDEVQHTVALTQGYWLGETPVTQGQWEAVMSSNPSHFAKGGTYPVESVSWCHCVQFCKAFQSHSPGPSTRLPSDAEWEYACRALTVGSRWDSHRPLGDYAWFEENSGGQTCSVGQRLPNPWGLYDMLGNVWEWCADKYTALPMFRLTDPYNARGVHNVVRGGSWRQDSRRLRVGYRYLFHPDSCWQTLGFRLARGAALQPTADPEPNE